MAWREGAAVKDSHLKGVSQGHTPTYPRGALENGPKVRGLQLGIVGENLLLVHPRGKPVQNVPNSDAQPRMHG